VVAGRPRRALAAEEGIGQFLPFLARLAEEGADIRQVEGVCHAHLFSDRKHDMVGRR
jgi:hypothetical protein